MRWVFAYGSLVFRPGFAYVRREIASIAGWERRLDQGSPDHRGTERLLGRVATLVRAPDARCVGVAYAIDEAEADDVLAMLDVREQGGYTRFHVDASLASGESVRAVTWIAAPDNPWFLGPAPLDAMIAQIRAARGPSGTNLEYVARLVESMRTLGIDDPHLAALAERLEG